MSKSQPCTHLWQGLRRLLFALIALPIVLVPAGCDSSKNRASPVSGRIGTAGGSITSADGRLTLTFPPGALAGTETIGIEPIDPADLTSELQALEPTAAYRLTPHGLRFAQPVTARWLSAGNPLVESGHLQGGIAAFAVQSSDGGIEGPPVLGIELDAVTGKQTLVTELHHFSDLTQVSRPFDDMVRRASLSRLVTVDVEYPRSLRVGQVRNMSFDIHAESDLVAFRDLSTAFVQLDSGSSSGLRFDNLGIRGSKVVGTVGSDERGIQFSRERIQFTETIECLSPGQNLRLEVTLGLVGPTRLSDSTALTVLTLSDGNDLRGPLAQTGTAMTSFVQLEIDCLADTGSANQAPITQPDTVPVQSGTITEVGAEGGVLANDSDPDGDALTAEVLTSPAKGTMEMTADGGVRYASDPGSSGSDRATYRACDDRGECSEPEDILFDIEGVPNRAPSAEGDHYDAQSGERLSVPPATGVLANDSDEDGDILWATAVGSGPANGVLIFNKDGSFQYTSDPGFEGTVSFSYRASDGIDASSPALVTIDVSKPRETACVEEPGNALRATAQIGPDGGTIRSRDGQVLLSFPAGALGLNHLICLDLLHDIPVNFKPVNAAYDLSAVPAVLSLNAAVILQFTRLNQLGEGALLHRADGSLAADLDIPVAKGADGSFTPIDGAQTRGDVSDGAPVRTEVPLTALPSSVFLPGEPAPAEGSPRLFTGTVTGARSAEVGTTAGLNAIASSNELFLSDLSSVEAAVRRVGGHTAEQIDFGDYNDGAFREMWAIGGADFESTIPYTCNQRGIYLVIIDLRFSGSPLFFDKDVPRAAAKLLNVTSIGLSLSCTAPNAAPTMTQLDPNEIASLERIVPILGAPAAAPSGAGASGAGPIALNATESAQNRFPVPNATADSIPLIVAGTGVGGADTARGVVAIDATTGAVLYRYGVQATSFDALPAEPPAADPNADVNRFLNLSGAGTSALSIASDGTEGMRALNGSSTFSDAGYLLGSTLGYTLTSPSGFVSITRYKLDAAWERERFASDGALYSYAGEVPANPQTAICNADASRCLVAGGTAGSPGELWLVDKSTQGSPEGTAIAVIAELGTNPRRLRCGPAPLSGTQHLCAISDFADSTVTLLTWDGSNAPTLGPAIPVGNGPVGIDVFENRVVAAGFNDNSFTVLTVDAADPLDEGTVTVVTRSLADITEVAGCTNPGHAVFLRDANRRVALSCHGSNGVAVIPAAFAE